MDPDSKRALIATPLVILVGTGLAAAGSENTHTLNGVPLFSIGIALAFIIQWVAFIPAFAWQTEKFYDLTGSITYLTVVLSALLLTPGADARAYILVGLVAIWAVRLGTFLFGRIQRAGEDRRFRDIKPSFFRFLLTWTLQGLWVSFSLAAALAAITSQTRAALDVFTLVGVAVWLFGFGFEVVADLQKSRFNADPANKGKFIKTGLWAWSRHPNYFGEIVLWIGVTIIALPVLQGWQWLTLISPVFITLLLTRISGVPMLEAHADSKWGGQADYEAYKSNTPVLIPRPPTK